MGEDRMIEISIDEYNSLLGIKTRFEIAKSIAEADEYASEKYIKMVLGCGKEKENENKTSENEA